MLTAPLYSYLSKSLFWFWEIFAKISKNSFKWYKINKLLFILPCLCKLATPSSCVTACVYLFILFAKMTKLFPGSRVVPPIAVKFKSFVPLVYLYLPQMLKYQSDLTASSGPV